MLGEGFCYAPHTKSDNVIRFVTTGNLHQVKGYDVLINAFHSAALPKERWTLDVIGGGVEYEKLLELINRYNLTDNIHLQGRKDRQHVIQILQNSDVYVLSSRLETFGVAAIEALACGLPVIATECGGTKEFMNTTNGITCPVENVEKLAECIGFMMNHFQEYDRAKIAADCQKKFSSEAIGKQLEGIFEEVIRKSKK